MTPWPKLTPFGVGPGDLRFRLDGGRTRIPACPGVESRIPGCPLFMSAFLVRNRATGGGYDRNATGSGTGPALSIFQRHSGVSVIPHAAVRSGDRSTAARDRTGPELLLLVLELSFICFRKGSSRKQLPPPKRHTSSPGAIRGRWRILARAGRWPAGPPKHGKFWRN